MLSSIHTFGKLLKGMIDVEKDCSGIVPGRFREEDMKTLFSKICNHLKRPHKERQKEP